MKNIVKTIVALVAISTAISMNAFAAKRYSFYVVSASGVPAKIAFITTQTGAPVEFGGYLSKNGKQLFTIVRVPIEYGIQKICYKGKCKNGSARPGSPLAVKF